MNVIQSLSLSILNYIMEWVPIFWQSVHGCNAYYPDMSMHVVYMLATDPCYVRCVWLTCLLVILAMLNACGWHALDSLRNTRKDVLFIKIHVCVAPNPPSHGPFIHNAFKTRKCFIRFFFSFFLVQKLLFYWIIIGCFYLDNGKGKKFHLMHCKRSAEELMASSERDM